MVVVSDTSPIRALCVLGLLDTLPAIFGEVLIPPQVAAELAVDVPGVGAVDVSAYTFLKLVSPTHPAKLAGLIGSLGAGESEALALALERHADFVLLDDADARAAATRLALVPLGVLGTLVRAKEIGLVPLIAPLLDQLVARIGFRISAPVRQRILELAGE